MKTEISLPNVVEVLRRHEQELHQIYADARLTPQQRRQIKDQAARNHQIAGDVQKHHERCSGVVRAKN